MNILFVASEMAPYAKTGGLADVVGALPRGLQQAGHDVRVVVPLYDTVDLRQLALVPVAEMMVALGSHRYSTTVFATGAGPTVYFVHCPALYARGRLYTSDPDEHRRFLALSYVALALCQRLRFAPDVVHVHDWQTALIPLLLKARFADDPWLGRARSLLTIHNLNYQGGFPASIGPDTNLTDLAHLFHQELLGAGRVNFLLQGILYADGVSTVSPTYAKEIQTPAHGAGLDGFLRARASTVVGILNGVDYDEWSPERDRYIPARYSAADLRGKAVNKRALAEALGLPAVAGAPMLGIVSRLVSQKGLDLLGEVAPGLLARHGFQLAVLGSGEPGLEDMFTRLQRAFPRQVCFYQGFNNKLAHLIEAGADMFLMPSRYEPCGLNQLYSLRYGTVPIVHKTGGLADTVRLWNPRTGTGTGFVFDHHDAGGLRWAIQAALATYRDQPAWARLVDNGMAQDFSWTAQVKRYHQLYLRLVRGPATRS
ncbi:MAG: glycogen synthase GlgA [Kofleriaceae bacterium]